MTKRWPGTIPRKDLACPECEGAQRLCFLHESSGPFDGPDVWFQLFRCPECLYYFRMDFSENGKMEHGLNRVPIENTNDI